MWKKLNESQEEQES